MPRVWRLLSVIVLLLLPLPALAAERTVSDVVLVDSGTVIPDDLYAAGNRVLVEGRVDGDLIASAFADVEVSGTVTGDVVAVAGTVTVTGEVGGSVRAVAGTVVIDGQVEGDVVVLGWSPAVAATVAGDVLMWGWDGAVVGEVGGDLEGQTRNLTIGGSIDGDVDVTVSHLGVESGAIVGGDLGYRSSEPSPEVGRAEVGGVVVHRLPLEPNVRIRALFVMAKVVLGLMAAIVGLLLMWAAPEVSRRAADAVKRSWWRAWLWGLALCLSPLVVIALAALLLTFVPTEAALPVVGVMVPIFLAVVGVLAALALAAPAAVYPWIGQLGNRWRSPVKAFLVGATVVTVAALVPYVSWLIALAVVPIGMGAWVAGGRDGVTRSESAGDNPDPA